MKKSLKLAAAGLLAALALAFVAVGPAHARVLGTWLYDQLIVNGTETVNGALTVTGALTTGSTNITTSPLTATYAAFTTGAAGHTVSVATATGSQFTAGIAGAFVSLPTSGYAEGTLAYQVSDHTLYVATAAVTNVGHWKAAF